ncbi:unnamed protein product [Adineta ricciae]|uniref:Tubulin/FtsZ GTPase domain-containing protein n=1 Tax=Adineta ricciae TaxID=249248 RepID=A0A814J3J1_ADIRI|nr:unnamed protein product [Adineta ricciae]CAF1144758.1 unnamed protein product [Adineta ricciae]
MHEIFTIQVGQFWEYVCHEHGIDSMGMYHGDSDLQLERINVYFTEVTQGKYVPRSAFTDLDEYSVNKIRNSMYRQLFRPDLIVNGNMSASNNFAKGFFTEGAEILPELLEKIRQLAEECDVVHGFQFLHSIRGGCGGGLGSLLLDHIRQEYPDRIIKSYSIVPALSMSQVFIDPYNAVLTMNHLIENADETFCFDNDALFEILHRTLRFPPANDTDINQILAQVMIGVTACFRFPGQLNMDLRKLAVNMIPFPALHFLMTSLSPIQTNSYQNLTEQSLCKIAHCDIPPKGLPRSVTGISNHTGIVQRFDYFLQPFKKLFQRRAFIHWFIDEGMEEIEISEAGNRIDDLIKQYKSIDNQ